MFKAMLKRDLRPAVRSLLTAVLLSALLAGICAGAFWVSVSASDSGESPVRVALFDGEDSFLSRLCIKMVRQLDFMEKLLDIESVTEEEARSGVADGSYAAAILLPEGFTDQILRGKASGGSILLSDAAGASAELVSSITAFGELLLAAGQYGVFAGQAILSETGRYEASADAFLAQSNTELLDTALTIHESGFHTETVPYTETGLSAASHYFLSFVVFFLLFCGVFMMRLYRSDLSAGLPARLFAAGITPFSFSLGKCLYPFLLRLLLLGALVPVISALEPLQTAFTPDIPRILLAAAGLLLLTLFTSSVCALMPSAGAGTALLFLLGLIHLFIGGILLPRSSVPGTILHLSEMLPGGAFCGYFAPLFGGKPTFPALLAGALYGLVPYLFYLRYLAALPGHRRRSISDRSHPAEISGKAAAPRRSRLLFHMGRLLAGPLLLIAIPVLILLPLFPASVGTGTARAAYCTEDGSVPDEDAQRLAETLESLGYERWDSEDLLRGSVRDGSLEAGSIIPGDLSQRLEKSPKKALILIESEGAFLTPLYREQAAAALFSVYAPYITHKALLSSLQGEAPDGFSKELTFQVYYAFLDSGHLFSFSAETLSGVPEKTDSSAGRIYRGIFSMTVFALQFFAVMLPLNKDYEMLRGRIPAKAARRGLLPGLLLRTGLLYAGAAISMLLAGRIFGADSTALLMELLRLLVYIVLTEAFSALLLRLLPVDAASMTVMFLLLAACALSPFLFDLSLLFPVVKILRLMCPPCWL